MSQEDLAKALSTSQNAISRLENPQYGKASLSTLKAIASFFDVALIVRFAPYSELAKWTESLDAAAMNVPAFADDAGFTESVAVGVQEAAAIANNKLVRIAAGWQQSGWNITGFRGSTSSPSSAVRKPARMEFALGPRKLEVVK